jgi:hypothetical protein
MAKNRNTNRAAIMAKYRPRVRQSGTSLSSNNLELPLQVHGELTEKQKKQAVNDHDLPDCLGNPDNPCQEVKQPMMIKGYDDQMRCPPCNRVHVELVYQEAGRSDPSTVAPKVNPRISQKAISKEMEIRRRIMHKCKPRDGWTEPPQIRAAPGDRVDMKGSVFGADGHIVESREAPAETDGQRRDRILAKYGQRRGGGAYGG